jgi:hypothetical protein
MPSLIVFRSSVNTIIYPYTYPIRATDTVRLNVIERLKRTNSVSNDLI